MADFLPILFTRKYSQTENREGELSLFGHKDIQKIITVFENLQQMDFQRQIPIVENSEQTGHLFRFYSDTHFGINRTPISVFIRTV